MKQIVRIFSISLLLMVASLVNADEPDKLAATLQQVVEDNLAAYNSENLSATLQSIHTKSPVYSTMQTALPDQFDVLDAKTELVRFSFIGHDDEFAVARVELKTSGKPGEPFAANIIDTITMFHQEDGVWKYWSDHILGVRLVE